MQESVDRHAHGHQEAAEPGPDRGDAGAGAADGHQRQAFHGRDGQGSQRFSLGEAAACGAERSARNGTRRRPHQPTSGEEEGGRRGNGHQHQAVIQPEQRVGQTAQEPAGGAAVGLGGMGADQRCCPGGKDKQRCGEAFPGIPRSAPRTVESRTMESVPTQGDSHHSCGTVAHWGEPAPRLPRATTGGWARLAH